MIYLTTGANGAGKTLNTLKLIREKQVAEGRSVYYDGFDMDSAKAAEFGWQHCDPTKWEELPDGAIVIWDECQRNGHLPTRGTGAAKPRYVEALGEHRKRGFDFYLITQHPSNIDKFVRGLIGPPGWHRHLKRVFGSEMVSELKWSAVNVNCEKSGAGRSAEVSMKPFPKDVYSWYKSAVLHTGKRQIPKQVYVLGVLLFAVPALFYAGYKQVTAKASPQSSSAAPAAQNGSVATPQKLDYFAGYVPRIEGLPHTAPRYDEVTKPTTAPFPAACVNMGNRCGCYSQQGTALDVPPDLCKQIVKRGFFQDWQDKPANASQPVAATQTPVQVAAAAPASEMGPWSVSMGGTPRGQAAGTSAADGAALASMRGRQSATN